LESRATHKRIAACLRGLVEIVEILKLSIKQLVLDMFWSDGFLLRAHCMVKGLHYRISGHWGVNDMEKKKLGITRTNYYYKKMNAFTIPHMSTTIYKTFGPIKLEDLHLRFGKFIAN
jgi:hypothetical protein